MIRKNKLLFILILLNCIMLFGCRRKESIEYQEMVDHIVNYEQASESIKEADTRFDATITPIEAVKKDEEEIPTYPIEDIEIVYDSSKAGFYEKLIIEDPLKHESYLNILNALMEKRTKAVIPFVDDNDLIFMILDYVILDHPEYIYNVTEYYYIETTTDDGTSAWEIEFLYDETFWNLSEMDKYYEEMESEAKKILSKVINIDGDYNKILYIYNYLAQNITYDLDSPDDYTIYGALVNKKASCEGYSETLKYLLDILEIETILVTGHSQEEGHQWNMIKLENEWYYFDVTWDSSSYKNNRLPYYYFALTSEELSKTHELTYESLMPLANSNKYNYFYYNDLVLLSYDEKSLLDITKRSLTLNPNRISFKVEDDNIYNMVTENISEWLPKIVSEISQSEYSHILNAGTYVIEPQLNSELKIIDIYFN